MRPEVLWSIRYITPSDTAATSVFEVSTKMSGTLLSICFAFLIFTGPASSEIKLGSIFENPSVLNDMGDGLHEWMRWLDDGLRINKISIPGTHDSMADRKFCNKLIFDFKDIMSVAAQEELLNFWHHL